MMVVLVQSTKLRYMRLRAFLYTTCCMAAIRQTMQYPVNVHAERGRKPYSGGRVSTSRKRDGVKYYIRNGGRERKRNKDRKKSHRGLHRE